MFWWSKVLTCRTDDAGLVLDCVENDIENAAGFFD